VHYWLKDAKRLELSKVDESNECGIIFAAASKEFSHIRESRKKALNERSDELHAKIKELKSEADKVDAALEELEE
jgi:DNA-binding transcriptional MerR regulator